MSQPWLKLLLDSWQIQISERPVLRKIIGNAAWLLGDRVLRMGVGLVVGVWVARYLGPVQFGLWNYAIAFVVLLSPLGTLGLESIVVRDLIGTPDRQNTLLGTAFCLKLLGSGLTVLVGIALIAGLRPGEHVLCGLVLLTAASMVFQAFDVIDFWFQAQVQSRYPVLARNMAFLILALVKVAMIQFKAPLIAFAWAWFAELGLAAVGLVVAYQMQGKHLSSWRINLAQVKKFLGEGWALALSGIAIMVYMKIDQIMLGSMIGDKSVGIYSAAVRLSELWYFIPGAIISSATPAIMQAKQVGEELYHQKFQQLLNGVTMLAISIALPLSFLAKPMVGLLFGPDYAEAAAVLVVHIWSTPFVFLGLASMVWVTAAGLFGRNLIATIVGGLSNIGLNLYLIPRYGTVGAAIATLLSYMIAAYLINALVFWGYPVFKMQSKALFFPFSRMFEASFLTFIHHKNS
jgi:polysaccharide transporter, PST family